MAYPWHFTGNQSESHPFQIDGKKVKSLNQNYNRRVSSLKEGKPQGYWDFELARITEKRNHEVLTRGEVKFAEGG